MKQYTVIHRLTRAHVAGPFNDRDQARLVAKAFGTEFITVMWAGFSGVPSVACIFRDDGQLETVCHDVWMAQSICETKNEQLDDHDYNVEIVLLNTEHR